MAYKPRVALAASVTLIICSVILLGLYIACGIMNCSGIPVSYGSPLWTGVLTLLTGIIGVVMSTRKSEKGCGPLFLAVSIICIFISSACMCLSAYASVYGLLQPDLIGNFCLWMAMMCTALVLSIVTCVTSCQYCCCCQETQPAETVIVYQGGPQVPPNIILTSPNTIQQPQQQGQPQVVFLNPYGASPGGQFIHQGYSVPQVLNQPIGGAPAGLPWHPPHTNAARGVYPNQCMVAPGQQQPSSPPPPYQEQAPVANQMRPVTAGQDQSQAVQPSTTPCPQPPSIYQPLITQNNQTSASQIQQTYFTPEQAQQEVGGPPQHPPDPPSNPTDYAQTTEQSSAKVTDDGIYLDPNTKSSSPPETPASGIDSEAYEYIEEPSYDYADPGVARENVSSAEHSQYINDFVAKRPKAKRPK